MSAAIFSELHASPRTFRVVLACTSRLNSLRAEAVGGSTTPLPPPPMSTSPGRFCATPLPSDSVGGDIGVAEGGDGGSGGGSGGGGANSSGSNTVSTTSGEAGEAAEDSCRSRQATAAAVVDQSSANAASNALDVDKQLPATADGHGDDGGAGWLPRRTSLAINLASGEPFPCRFEGAGRGPAWEVRYSRMFACGWKPLLSDVSFSRQSLLDESNRYFICIYCHHTMCSMSFHVDPSSTFPEKNRTVCCFRPVFRSVCLMCELVGKSLWDIPLFVAFARVVSDLNWVRFGGN